METTHKTSIYIKSFSPYKYYILCYSTVTVPLAIKKEGNTKYIGLDERGSVPGRGRGIFF
jgi:hypothetical protein